MGKLKYPTAPLIWGFATRRQHGARLAPVAHDVEGDLSILGQTPDFGDHAGELAVFDPAVAACLAASNRVRVKAITEGG